MKVSYPTLEQLGDLKIAVGRLGKNTVRARQRRTTFFHKHCRLFIDNSLYRYFTDGFLTISSINYGQGIW